MSLPGKNHFTTIVLSTLIGIYLIGALIVQLAVVRPLKAEFTEQNNRITSLKKEQEDKTELLNQIDRYREGLYVLNLLLEARKNVISGSDEENPHLVFNFTQVLDDLRRLLPRDARVMKFQVNNKGLLTMPIESVDYASLGRVLKSVKDSSLFAHVSIPSAAQLTRQQINEGWRTFFQNVYSFVIQTQLDPAFWQNPMPYPDVSTYDYFAQAVRDLTIAGSIEGYPDGTFRPDRPINRAEFFKVTLFEFLANKKITIDEYKQYIDLSEKDWHYQYIQLASKMGVVEGGDVGRFHPEQTISRLEALKMIFKIYEIELEEPEAAAEEGAEEAVETEKKVAIPFVKDVRPDDPNYPLIKKAAELGLIQHFNGVFGAKKAITRAEITYWVWKIKFDFL